MVLAQITVFLVSEGEVYFVGAVAFDVDVFDDGWSFEFDAENKKIFEGVHDPFFVGILVVDVDYSGFVGHIFKSNNFIGQPDIIFVHGLLAELGVWF